MTPLADLLADGSIAVLKIDTNRASPLTSKFLHDAVKVLHSTAKKLPVVHLGEHALVAIYRALGDATLLSPLGGAAFRGLGKIADTDSSYRVSITSDRVLPDEGFELPAGSWLDDRSPENTARHALPVLSSDALVPALNDLVERWTAAGDIVEIARPARVSRKPDVSKINFWEHPRSWDAADPRRFGDDSREKVLRLRREAGIPNSDERDFESEKHLRQAAQEHQRQQSAEQRRQRA